MTFDEDEFVGVPDSAPSDSSKKGAAGSSSKKPKTVPGCIQSNQENKDEMNVTFPVIIVYMLRTSVTVVSKCVVAS